MSYNTFSLTSKKPHGRVSTSSHPETRALNRPVSPLLHDYKQSDSGRPKKSKALQWFAVGLGIPIAAVALNSMLGKSTPDEPQSTESVMMASLDAPIIVPPVDQAELADRAPEED